MVIDGNIIQLLHWEEFEKPGKSKFKKYFMWFHLGKYLEMYLKLPIIISNLLDTKFFDMHDLDLIEIYEKIKKKAVVLRVKTNFDFKKPFPLDSGYQYQSLKIDGYHFCMRVCQ